VQKRGRPRLLDAGKCSLAKDLFVQGHSIGYITRALEISRATFYRYCNSWKVPELRVGIVDYFKRSVDYYNSFPDGNHLGHFETQVAKLLAVELKQRIRFVPVSFPRLFSGIQSGEFAIGMGLIGNSIKRRQSFSLSDPYGNLEGSPTGALIAKKALKISLSELSQYKALRIGTLAKSLSHDWLLQAGVSADQIVLFSYLTEFVSAFRANRVDAVMDGHFLLLKFIEANPEYELKGPMVSFDQVSISLLLGKGDDQILNRVNEGIFNLRRKHLIEPLEERIFHK
jgi:ABC-type amino acid transport substrate-binding protein